MNSEHAWVLENLETYTAGGLDPAESERLTQHIAGCPPCAAALAETRALDQAMSTVFADVQPSSALEDRMLLALRTGALRRSLRLRRFLLPAAVILMGIVGFGATRFIDRGELQFPDLALLSRAKQAPGTAPSAPLEGLSDQFPLSLDGYQGQASVFQRAEAFGRRGAVNSQDGDQKAEPRLASGALGAGLGGLGGGPGFGGGGGRSVTSSPAPEKNGDIAQPSATAAFASSNMLGDQLAVPRIAPGNASSPTPPPSVDDLAQKTRESLSIKGQPEQALPALDDKSVDDLPAAQVNNLGYYPPAQALVMKGSSRFHFKPGGGVVNQTFGDSLKDAEQKTQQDLYFHEHGKEGKDSGGQSATDSKSALSREKAPLQSPAEPSREAGNSKSSEKLGEKQIVANPVTKDNGVSRNLNETDRPPTTQQPPQAPAAARKIIIRTGDIEYEIESFDAAVAGVTKLTHAIPGAFIATVNSEKLPNGKVRGSVVVRIPPEALDSFVLDLRKDLGRGGELKSLKIGSQDITKQYTDLESRLRAARTMEERLLLIIKDGKGQIKDLLATEKELGNWRTQIESIEGELRFYGSQVALSTLTITLYEREIKAPYGLVTTERVQMGVEVEEVDKALQAALKAVTEVKGRVTKSELKQHAAGQFSALLHFEVAPDSAGPMRDRLRQLGTVTRLDVDRLQEAEGGNGPAHDAPVKQKDAQFQVSLYNIANVAPRETVILNLACTDAEAVYQSLLSRIRKAAGARVVTSNLNRQKNDQSTGTLNFEVKSSEADAMLAELKSAGEVLQLQFTENPDTQTVTRAKRGFNVQLVGMGSVVPRETTVLQIAARDVPAAERALQNAVVTVNGRIMNAQVNEQDRQNITAQLDFDIRRTELAQIDAALAQAGDVIRRDVSRAQEGDNVLDSKMRFQVALVAQSRIPARETTVLGIEVADVDTTKEAFEALAKEKQGRVAASTIARERNGRVTAKMTFDMPLAAADSLAARFKSAGKVRVQQSSQNLQVPEGPLAIGRVDVTLSNEDLIVPSDEGLWPQVRKGLSTSFFALAWSLTVVIVGLCFVLPWGLVSYGSYRLWQRVRPKPPVA